MDFDYYVEAGTQQDASFLLLEAVLLLPKPLKDILLAFTFGPLNTAMWVIELLAINKNISRAQGVL